MPDLTVITSPDCRGCTATKRRLDSRGREYTVRDVSTDPGALAIARELGHLATPVVIVRDATGRIVDHWSGYAPAHLDRYAPRSKP